MTKHNKDQLADMLEQADAQTMANDPIIRAAFSVAVLASDLFVPVQETQAQQAQNGGVSLQAIEIEGEAHVLLFSSKEKLAAFTDGETRFARAAGQDIFPSLRGAHAVLNPGPDGRAFAPDDIAQILGEPVGTDNPPHGHAGHVHTDSCEH